MRKIRGEQLGVAKPAAPPFPPSLGTQAAEVFWRECDKILRHTSQNFIAVGKLE